MKGNVGSARDLQIFREYIDEATIHAALYRRFSGRVSPSFLLHFVSNWRGFTSSLCRGCKMWEFSYGLSKNYLQTLTAVRFIGITFVMWHNFSRKIHKKCNVLQPVNLIAMQLINANLKLNIIVVLQFAIKIYTARAPNLHQEIDHPAERAWFSRGS